MFVEQPLASPGSAKKGQEIVNLVRKENSQKKIQRKVLEIVKKKRECTGPLVCNIFTQSFYTLQFTLYTFTDTLHLKL